MIAKITNSSDSMLMLLRPLMRSQPEFLTDSLLMDQDLSNDSLFDESSEGIVDEIKSMCMAACTSTAASSLCSTSRLLDSSTSMDTFEVRDALVPLPRLTTAQNLPAQNPPTLQARLEPLAEIDF